MYYKNGRITASLPNKLELDGKVIFNPKWHHFEAAGWKELPVELESVEKRFIKWIDGDPVEMTQEEKDAILNDKFENIKNEKISQLWQAATDYEQNSISGSAPAKMLQLAMEGDQRAVAVGLWIQSIWASYYIRRDDVDAATTIEELEAISEDFSSVGPIPYTVKEIIFGG